MENKHYLQKEMNAQDWVNFYTMMISFHPTIKQMNDEEATKMFLDNINGSRVCINE